MIWTTILDWFYPPRCMICHKFLPSGDHPTCDDCANMLLRQPAIVRREKGEIFCISPCAYEEQIRESVHRFKFGDCPFYAREYGKWMAAAVRSELTDDFDAVTWVPISFFRCWRRGFDQGKLLGKELAKQLKLPKRACLRKIRHNPAQSRTVNTEQRKKNVRDVYRVIPKAEIAGKKLLLVDDVVTTGSTLHECAKMLKRAGAAQVTCVTLASTK